MFSEDQLAHLKALDQNDPASTASFADRLEEDGHPLAVVFKRLHAMGEGVKQPGNTFIGQTGDIDFPDGSHFALGYGVAKRGQVSPMVRVGRYRIGLPKLYAQVPLRKTEWADLHKHFYGHSSEFTPAYKAEVKEPEQLAAEESIFSPDQLAHFRSVKGPKDRLGTKIFADRLQEDGHPLAGFFSRISEHQNHPTLKAYDKTERPGPGPWNDGPHEDWQRESKVTPQHLLKGYDPNEDEAYDEPDNNFLVRHAGPPRTYFSHPNLLDTGFLHTMGKKYTPWATLHTGGYTYHGPVTLQEMKEIHKAFPPKRVVHPDREYAEGEYRHLPKGKDVEQPAQFAASKAPQGGMIVNGTYYQGGKYLPRLLKRIRTVRKNAQPVQLARIEDVADFSQPSMRHEDLLSIENHHELPKHKRLSNSEAYKVGEDGRIANAKVEDLHKFLDAVAKSPKSGPPKNLKGEKLFAHLLTHAVKDASTYLPYVKGEWYGDSVAKMDHAIHEMVSREKPFDPTSHKIDNHPLWGKAGEQSPGLRLLKNVIGFTSNNQKPRDNLMSALKILRTGLDKHPARPFEHMDEYNVKPMHDFLEHLTRKHGPGDHGYVGHTDAERTAWHRKYGEDLKSHTKSLSGPVSMVEGLQDKDGNIVGRKNIAGNDVTFDGQPLPKGKYTKVPFPSTNEEGRLKAKGWSSRASTNAGHIRLLKKVIAATGGYQQAADWLEQRHPLKELEAMKGGPVKTGELEDRTSVPGMFVFGEKQGPFVANISGNPEHVTQDVWWTRSINRWLGNLVKGERAPNTTQKQFYARVAREAAKELGTSPANLQAILWYAEQHLYRLFGARSNSTDFSEAASHAKSAHGFS